MKSRVHPKYKTKYRVANWPECERSLVRRGDVTLEVPDHTTLSRRGKRLNVALRRIAIAEPIHLIVDSIGRSIVGEGEWTVARHGGKAKRGWKKLHIGVDRSGVIVAQEVTDGTADDAKTGPGLFDSVAGNIASITADAAYDTIAIYEAAHGRRAKVVVPPTSLTISKVRKLGRRRWKKELGCHPPPTRGPEQTTGASNGQNRSPGARVGAPTSPPEVQDSGLETRACPGEASCITDPRQSDPANRGQPIRGPTRYSRHSRYWPLVFLDSNNCRGVSLSDRDPAP